jgi:DeoR family ulaG and ulaABCDEF operon transcriptional repressor
MHAAERERMILDSLGESGFVSFRDLESRVAASPATIRRDLDRLEEAGVITRVRGGAKRVGGGGAPTASEDGLSGVPFHENIGRNRAAKEAIGRAAAGFCIRAKAL